MIVCPAGIGNAVVGTAFPGIGVVAVEGCDISVLFHARKRRVERRFLDTVFLAAHCLDLLGNLIAIGWLILEQIQDHGIIVATNDIAADGRHIIYASFSKLSYTTTVNTTSDNAMTDVATSVVVSIYAISMGLSIGKKNCRINLYQKRMEQRKC